MAEKAAAAGSYLWIDMEGSPYVEPTIRLYERLREVQPRTGICLQAYLKRTPSDIERLRPLDPSIRLVKGAYDETGTIAYRDKRQVDASYLAWRSTSSSPAVGGRSASVSGRTTSRSSSRSPSRSRRPVSRGMGSRSRCCTGSARESNIRLAKAGYRVQTLIAYGDAWYPWYMRRLAERPANVAFAIRSLLP